MCHFGLELKKSPVYIDQLPIRLLSLMLLLLVPAVVLAQSDTTALERKKWLPRTEIGYNFFAGSGADSLQNTARDLGSIKLNYVEQRRFYASTSPIYAGIGLGIGIFEWRFKDPLILRHDSRARRLLVFEDPDTLNEYGKSKLQVFQLMLPLEVGIQARRFNAAVGGHIGFIFASKHKRKYEREGANIRIREGGSDRLQLNQLQYGLMGRIAYGQVGVYAIYHLSPLFTDRGPDVQAVQVGVSFSQPLSRKNDEGFLDRLNLPGRTKTI